MQEAKRMRAKGTPVWYCQKCRRPPPKQVEEWRRTTPGCEMRLQIMVKGRKAWTCPRCDRHVLCLANDYEARCTCDERCRVLMVGGHFRTDITVPWHELVRLCTPSTSVPTSVLTPVPTGRARSVRGRPFAVGNRKSPAEKVPPISLRDNNVVRSICRWQLVLEVCLWTIVGITTGAVCAHLVGQGQDPKDGRHGVSLPDMEPKEERPEVDCPEMEGWMSIPKEGGLCGGLEAPGAPGHFSPEKRRCRWRCAPTSDIP